MTSIVAPEAACEEALILRHRANISARLTHISLFAADNELTGTVPDTFSSETTLQLLRLASNKLSGSIPHSLSSTTLLSEIDMSDNVVEGTIPDNLGLIPSLANLLLRKNRLQGGLSYDYLSDHNSALCASP